MRAELRLIQFAEKMVGEPFVWGQTDCAVLALKAADVYRGHETDFAEAYRDFWTDEASALAHFQVELPSRVLEGFGFQSIEPARAAIGDIILAEKPPFPECAHVCLGKVSLTSGPEHGVGYVRTADLVAAASSAWRPR